MKPGIDTILERAREFNVKIHQKNVKLTRRTHMEQILTETRWYKIRSNRSYERTNKG